MYLKDYLGISIERRVAMTKQELINAMLAKGYSLDRYGHLTKTIDGKEYRIKLQAKSFRKDVKVHIEHSYGPPTVKWVRLYGGYYGQCYINDEGRIAGKISR